MLNRLFEGPALSESYLLPGRAVALSFSGRGIAAGGFGEVGLIDDCDLRVAVGERLRIEVPLVS